MAPLKGKNRLHITQITHIPVFPIGLRPLQRARRTEGIRGIPRPHCIFILGWAWLRVSAQPIAWQRRGEGVSVCSEEKFSNSASPALLRKDR